MIPTFLVVDLFCGAGGTSTGFVLSGCAKVVACVNHDHNAIVSHHANYGDIKHFEEDIREVSMPALAQVVRAAQNEYPDALLILWASLECTNFSKAKGGLARDADSRTLADHLHRYITALDPDYVMIENVTEFMDWGPLRVKMKNGKPVMIKNKHGETVEGYEPIPELKGVDFKRWCCEVCAHGYVQEWRQMNSADYGAFTSRNRLFGMFAKEGMPLVWPEPTHAKNGKGGLTRWNAVKEKLDFSDEGYSIFYRGRNMNVPKRQRKDLSDNTLERVYHGCIKHIAGGKKNFLIKYHGGKPRTNDTEKPLTVIDTQNRHALISVYHGNGDNTFSTEEPGPTIAAADINAVVFLDRDFTAGASSSIDQPAGSITGVPKMNLVQAQTDMFLTKNYSGKPEYKNLSIEQPAATITTFHNMSLVKANKSPYLIVLQYGGQMSGVDRPAPTLLASGDKTPVYLIITESGDVTIRVYDDDSEIVKRLKEFMAMYGFTDIKMRMLRDDELMQIQGFPKGYLLYGTQSDRKKFIGNSVVPDVVKAWALAMNEGIVNEIKVA